jgi:hypothetical protein
MKNGVWHCKRCKIDFLSLDVAITHQNKFKHKITRIRFENKVRKRERSKNRFFKNTGLIFREVYQKL